MKTIYLLSALLLVAGYSFSQYTGIRNNDGTPGDSKDTPFNVKSAPPRSPLTISSLPDYYNYNIHGTNNSYPLNIESRKDVQLLYLPGDFNQPSPAPAGTIGSISFRIADTYPLEPTTYTDLTIKMGQSTITSFSGSDFYTGNFATVYYRASVTLTGTAGEWMTIPLDTPFPYDPAQSLIIDIGQCGAPGVEGFSLCMTILADYRRNYSVGGCPFVYSGSDASVYHIGISYVPDYYNYNTNGSTNNSFPLNIAGGKDVQLLYLPGDFNQPSPAPAGIIKSLSFRIADDYPLGPATYTDLTIKMGQSIITSFPGGSLYTGTLTTVYYRASATLTGLAGHWMNVPLDTPFPYDPTQSLIIDIGQCGASGVSGYSLCQTTLTDNRRNWSVGGCPFVYYNSNSAIYHLGITYETIPFYYNFNTNGSNNSFPLNIASGKDVQLLYLPGDFNQPSPAPAGNISSISFRTADSYPLGPATYTDFTIKMGQASITSFTEDDFYTGPMTTVYDRASVTLTGIAGQWMTIPLDTEFPYDPAQSLIIDVGQCGVTGASGFSSCFTYTSDHRRNYSVGGCPFVYNGSSAYIYHLGISVQPPSNKDTVTIGTGTSLCAFPYTTFWEDGRTQFLLTAAEIIAAGGGPGSIRQIGFNVSSYSSQTMNGFNIRMQNTTLTSMTTSFITSDWITCYSGTYAVPGTGWQMITLQTPFDWDGSNLLVEICYDNNTYTVYSYVYGSTASNMCTYAYTDLPLESGCDYFTTGTVPNLRPNLRFTEIHRVMALHGPVTGTNCYNATETILVAGGGRTFTVENGGSVTMIAGQKILMLPKTGVESGGYLHAYISTSFCDAVPTAMVAAPVRTEELPQPSMQESSFFKVYPNPTTGNLTLEISGNVPASATVRIEIYSMQGERLLHEQYSGERKHELSLNGRPAGIYFIRVLSGGTSGSVKIIKQ
jgi:hypothetical protein